MRRNESLPLELLELLADELQVPVEDAALAKVALVWLGPGLVAFSLVNILARAFYSLGDVKTPMRISVFCLTLNVLLVLVLITRFKQAGLGAASTATATLNAALLAFALRKKIVKLGWKSLIPSISSMAGAGVVAGAAAWFSRNFWVERMGYDSFLLRLGEVFVPMTIAAILYFGICLLLKVEALAPLSHFISTRFRKKQ